MKYIVVSLFLMNTMKDGIQDSTYSFFTKVP